MKLHFVYVPPLPMMTFTEKARSKVLEFLKEASAGTALRIAVSRTPDNQFHYDFELEEYHAERPDDIVVREGGFITRFASINSPTLRDAVVDWGEEAGCEGFIVRSAHRPNVPGTAEDLKEGVLEAIRTIYDPEIPMVNIFDLGLIYDVVITKENVALVTMTLTAPNCPAAEQLPQDVKVRAGAVDGIREVEVEITFDPPWTPERMSEAARLTLNL